MNEVSSDHAHTVVKFPSLFSVMKNNDFMDHIADAEKIMFDRTFYCSCQSVEVANSLLEAVKNLHFHKNSVASVNRFGPAFLAMRKNRYQQMKNVLVVRNLVTHSSKYVLTLFPSALDVCMKKKMAIVIFKTDKDAKLAFLSVQNMEFSPEKTPKVEIMKGRGGKEKESHTTDPDLLLHGHPKKLIQSPNTVCVTLKNPFDLKVHIKMLQTPGKLADDIILSRSCSVWFNSNINVDERLKILGDLEINGEKLIVNLQGDKKRKRDDTDETSGKEETQSEEEEDQLPVKKNNKMVKSDKKSGK